MRSPLRDASTLPVLKNRWKVVGPISESRRGWVLLAQDLLVERAPCVLKLFPVPGERELQAARREFQVLRRLSHPGLVRAFDFGHADPQVLEELGRSGLPGPVLSPPVAYIVLSHFEGEDLRHAFLGLFPGGEAALAYRSDERWRTFYKVVARICLALEHIHTQGLVHYDIKPENILLARWRPRRFPADEDVKIIDFGLCEQETTPLGVLVRGTVPYIAPELFDRGEGDRRSDLFSLGATLACAVAGRHPFPGRSASEWIAMARAGRFEKLADLRPGTPEPFSRLVSRLLAPEPAERPRSALEVVTELESLGRFRRPRLPPQPPAVPRTGWEKELHLIEGELEQLRRGESSTALLFVESDEGQFTESFLEETRALAAAREVEFACGSCARTGRYPYSPLSEALEQVFRKTGLPEAVRSRFGPLLKLLVPGAPEVPDEPLPCPPAGPVSFLDQLSQLVLELSRERPLVIALRDLHLGGGDVLNALRSVARHLHLGGTAAGTSRILVLATFQTPGDAGGGGDLAQILEAIRGLAAEPYCLRLRLRALSVEQVREWAEARAPWLPLTSSLQRKLFEVSRGVPRHLDLCLRWLSREGEDPAPGVSGEPGGPLRSLEREGDPLEERTFQLPQTLHEGLLALLQQLSPADRELLECLAVARAPVPAFALKRLAGGPGRQAGGGRRLAQARRLEELGFLESRPGLDGPEWVFTVDSVRRALDRQLSEALRSRAHGRLCEALARGGQRLGPAEAPEDVAYHARQAHREDVYREHALHAARTLTGACAFEGAAETYERLLSSLPLVEANAGAGKDGGNLRWQINTQLVEIYQKRGLLSRALEKLTVLLSLPRAKAWELGTVYRQMGEIHLALGQSGDAAYYLERSLKTLEAELTPSLWPESHRHEFCRTLLALARYALDQGEPETAQSRAEECLEIVEARAGPPELLSEAYRLIGETYGQQNDHARSLTYHVKAVAAAERARCPEALTRAITAAGNECVAQGKYDRAISYFETGLGLAEKRADTVDMALFHSELGTVYHHRGEYQRALECFRRSLRLSQQIGDTRAIANSYNNLGSVYRLRDETHKAAESYERAIDLYAKINDQFGMAAGMTNLASILEQEGKYSEALEYSFRALDKRKRLQSRARLAFSYYRIGRIYQSKGELSQATTYAEKAMQLRKELGDTMDIAYSQLQLAELHLKRAHLFEAFQLAQQALRTFLNLKNPIGQLLARLNLVRVTHQVGMVTEARDDAARLLDEARHQEQRAVVGDCLLELAMLAMDAGDLHEAEHRLREAERSFRQNRSRRQLVETLLAETTLKLELGHREHAVGLLDEAYSLLEELGIRDLVPLYFLLRGRMELETPGRDSEAVRKFLQRGVVEAREAQIPDLVWRFHHHIGLLEETRGDHHLARIHFSEAREILQGIHRSLPLRFQEKFFELRDRAALLAAGLGSGREAPPGATATETAPARPQSDPTVEATLHQELLRLHEIAAAIGSEENLDKLLERILDAVLDLVNAERGFLILKESAPGQSRITLARHFDKEPVSKPEQKISESLANEVLATGQPVLAGDALAEQRFAAFRSVRDLRLKSLACVPLKFRGETLGALYLDNRHRRDAFGESDLKLLRAFSDQAAVAIANARLIEENHRRAQDLLQANRRMEALNLKLRRKVHSQSARLAVAQQDLRERQSQLECRYSFRNITGKSKAMQEIFFLLERLSESDLPVLLQGESGTGKELIARAIHYHSPHRQGRFVCENCGALTESLLETELFGHTRGAFTGAVQEKKGLFELAHGGTLFLDEIADMSLAMQQKLLRVLQEGEIRPVGGKDLIRVDVRVISASNRNLVELVAEGKFREDLYYRLNGVRVDVPPLRERQEDIPRLIEHFLQEAARESGEKPRRFSPEAMRVLMDYDWPGNVRELRHFIEKTLLVTTEKVIGKEDIHLDRRLARLGALARSRDGLLFFRKARDAFERRYLEELFESAGYSVTRAARLSGLSRESLYRLMRKHGLRKVPES